MEEADELMSARSRHECMYCFLTLTIICWHVNNRLQCSCRQEQFLVKINKLSWFSCISHYVRQRAIQIASRFCKRTFIRAKEKFAMFFFATLSSQIFFAANNTIPGCFPTSLRSLAVCTNAKFNPPEPVKP